MTVRGDSKLFVKIVPVGIVPLDQFDLPSAVLPLQTLLPSKRFFDTVVRLRVNKSLEAITFCETLDEPLIILVDPPRQIVGNANVK